MRNLDAQGRLGHPPRPGFAGTTIFMLVTLLGLTTYALGRSGEIPPVLLLVAAAGVFGIAVAVGWSLAVAEYRAAQQADRAAAELLLLHAELDKDRREYAARLHDVRALTGAIDAALHALGRSGADPAIVAALSAQIGHLRHLLTESAGTRLEPVAVAEVLLQVSSFATLHGVALIHEAADHTAVLADRDQMVAILENLVDNARKYAPGPPILITCEPAGPYVKLAVHDDGPGIAPDQVEDLFLPGVREGEGTQGYGMGLAIARSLAEGMHGALWYEPRSGRGSRFVLKLRRAAEEPAGADEKAP
jgi:signal transduction histidine kinase